MTPMPRISQQRSTPAPRLARTVAALAAACGLCLGAPALAQTAPAGISDDIVRLGLVLDMSGIYADVTGKGSATAAQMAIDDFGGTVLGKKIDLLVADHQNKADIAAARAREWYDTQKVDAIMDVAGSAPALAVLETPQPQVAEYNRAGAEKFMKTLDRRLADREFIADRFTIADIVAVVGLDFGRLIKYRPPAELENLARWLETCRARPAAKAGV